MKKLIAFAVSAFVLCADSALSQTSNAINQPVADKPLLFSSLPEKIDCNLEEVDRLFSAVPSKKLVLQISNNLTLDGTVMEKVQQSPEVLSINFKSANYSGALFNISRIIQNGTIRYVGTIVSKEHGDVLTLVKENEKYFFTRQPQKFFMVE